MMKHSYPKIGAHVSVAGGLKNGVENAASMGAACMQVFGSSPRQWKVRMPTEKEITEYVATQKKDSISPVYLHASYLVNLGSANEEIYAKSKESLVGHLQITEAIGADGLIFHVGAHKKGSRKEASSRVVAGIKEVLRKVSGKSHLAMENSATPAKLGDTIEEIEEIFKQANSPRLKVCMDTAHAYASGILEFTEEGIKEWCDKLDKALGLDNVVALHVNDSKAPFGSGVDRHENMGQGYIGKKGMALLAKEQRLWDKAWILEVPGFENMGPDKKNVDILKSYFT